MGCGTPRPSEYFARAIGILSVVEGLFRRMCVRWFTVPLRGLIREELP